MTEKRKVTVDGEDFEVEIRPGEGNWEVSIEGRTYTVEIEGLERKKQRKRSAAKTSSTTVSGIISSAIPGKIVAIMAAEGDVVEEKAIEYMTELWDTLGKELTNSHRLQKVVKWKRLMNWFVGKSSRKKEMGDMLTGMIADKEAQKALWSPWFLFKTILLP